MFIRKTHFKLDGVEFDVSPLTVKQFEEIATEEQGLKEGDNQGRLALLIKVAATGIRNANPSSEMTPEKLREESDLTTILAVRNKVLEISQLTQVPEGER